MLAIKARFSGETVSHYGDNGLPKEAAEVMAAAKETVGPLPFEPPHQYRARMRDLDDLAEAERAVPEQLIEPLASDRRPNMAIVGLKGERVRLVPPDRTLHLENALVWLNDPEVTATIKLNLGVTRRQEELFFESDRNQARHRLRLGDRRRGRAGTSASSACTGSTGETAGRPAAS